MELKKNRGLCSKWRAFTVLRHVLDDTLQLHSCFLSLPIPYHDIVKSCLRYFERHCLSKYRKYRMRLWTSTWKTKKGHFCSLRAFLEERAILYLDKDQFSTELVYYRTSTVHKIRLLIVSSSTPEYNMCNKYSRRNVSWWCRCASECKKSEISFRIKELFSTHWSTKNIIIIIM